jgi:putative addiction module component (TIGR02574 family)
MPLTVEQLAEEAMQLSPTSRAELAEKLVESLDVAELTEIDRLWAKEAIRRRDEVRQGLVKTIPEDEALAQVRRSLGR